MKPKDGKSCTLVSPEAPKAALEADKADPGEVAQVKAREREIEKGKYGQQKIEPFKPSEEKTDPEETSWIEIELVDEADNPVGGERYEVTLPDGRVASGTLDGEGWARVEGFKPGSCKVCFPKLDKEAWEFIESVGEKHPPVKLQ
jgi:hypothetical protein